MPLANLRDCQAYKTATIEERDRRPHTAGLHEVVVLQADLHRTDDDVHEQRAAAGESPDVIAEGITLPQRVIAMHEAGGNHHWKVKMFV